MDTASRPAAAGSHLLRDIATGAVCGLLAIVQSIGFGTLLFSGVPASVLPAAVGMGLAATCVSALLTPSLSSGRGIIATSQSVPAAALAGIVAAVAMHVASGEGNAILATLVATVALASLSVGAAAWLLGRFGLSRFIRFIPFPVVAGFLAGSGWLVMVGGIDAIAGFHLAAAPLSALNDAGMIARLGAAATLIAAVALAEKLTASRLVLPVAIAAALILFNGVVGFGAIPADTLRAGHWLIALSGGGTLWPPIALADLALIDWAAIAGQALSLPTVPFLTVIAILMSATGIELDSRRDLDLDRELRAAGLANLAGGIAGGTPAYHSLSLTVLGARLGAPDAFAGLVVAGFSFAALLLGSHVLSAVPLPLLGGVLVWIGAGLINQWLVKAYARLAIAEYVVVVLIFAIIAFVGFAWGILVGLLAAAVLFAVEYGRVDIVRYTLTGRDYQTHADSSDERLGLLRGHGDAILLLRLQGFLFFGTAERLRKRIQRQITQRDRPSVRFLVIDFHRVSGLDSSAVLSFVRLSQMAGPEGFTLVLTGMSGAVEKAMRRGGLELGNDAPVRIAPAFEQGVEWCENALLADVAPGLATARTRPARDILLEVVGDAASAEALMQYLERADVKAGQPLIVQGQPSDDIFFIEEGRASVELANGAQTVRVATVTHGAIVGEVAFYRSVPRSASVIAETDMLAWRFSRAGLERLRAAEPEIAARFHQGMSAMLAGRLMRTNRLIQLLAD